MPNPGFTANDLTTLFERLDVRRARARASSADAQIDVLLARVATLTVALGAAPPNDTAHLASRLLLDDLAMIAEHFRSRTNAMRASLTSALDNLREALEVIERSS